MKFVFSTALIIVSVAVGLVLVEAAYRAFLWVDQPALFTAPAGSDKVAFGFYDKSHWEYDEALGYVYPPGREIMLGNVADNRLVACDHVTPINERGNIGPIRGDYGSAGLKILLFGDSFPAYIVNGETFPSELQARLNQIPGVDAHIVNFGRDGTGILQMFDLAAKMVPEWKPDLVIFTFITDDLDRVRIWRQATHVNGEPRILVSDRPDPAGNLPAVADAFMWAPETTMEWCRETLDNSGRSPELTALIDRYRRLKDAALAARPGLLSVDHSFVLALLLRRDPMARQAQTVNWQVPRVKLDDYRQDPKFVAALEGLEETGTPILYIHLPIAPELQEGEPNLSEAQKALWQSLEAATGQRVYRLSDHIVPELDDPLAISHQPPVNHHPSPFGMKVYASAIARVMAEAGALPDQDPAAFVRPPSPKRNKGSLSALKSDLRCPFRLIAADGGGERQLPLWTIFRSFIDKPPAQIVARGVGKASQDSDAACRFEVEPVPGAALNGFDWRIGHSVAVDPAWIGKTATVKMTLSASQEMHFGRASVYSYDGDKISYRTVDSLDPTQRVFAFEHPLMPGVESFEVWFRIALESSIEPGGTITMSDTLVEVAPN